MTPESRQKRYQDQDAPEPTFQRMRQTKPTKGSRYAKQRSPVRGGMMQRRVRRIQW